MPTNDFGAPGAPAAPPAGEAEQDSGPVSGRKSRLWLWFVAAFVVQIGVWAVWFVIASRHPVQEVPLVHTR